MPIVKLVIIQTHTKSFAHFLPTLGRSPGGGSSNPLHYSFLENPMDRGAWQVQSKGCKESDMTEQARMLNLPNAPCCSSFSLGLYRFSHTSIQPPLAPPWEVGWGEGSSLAANGTLTCWLAKYFGYHSWAMWFDSSAPESCIREFTAVETVHDNCFRRVKLAAAVG
jgi:hypothetical protein